MVIKNAKIMKCLSISYDLNKYVSHVLKNYQSTWTKFINNFARIPNNSYSRKIIKRWSK